MKNSKKVVETLVDLASNDKIPMDMNELCSSHFDFVNKPEKNLKDIQEQLKIIEHWQPYEFDDEVGKAMAEIRRLTEDIE